MFWRRYRRVKKYKPFSVPIEEEVIETDKDGNGSVVTISYKIKFIDSVIFMATSLSNLVDNLAEGIHKLNVKIVNTFLNMKVSKTI